MNLSEIAKSHVGQTHKEAGLYRSTEECAEFVSTCLNELDSESFTWGGVLSISCNDLRTNLLNSGLAYEPEDDMLTDDILFFNWGHDFDIDYPTKPLDHVAIVTKKDQYGVWYIDANSDSTQTIKEHHIDYNALRFNCEYPDYYLRLKRPDQPVEVRHLTEDEQHTELLKQKLAECKNALNELIILLGD